MAEKQFKLKFDGANAKAVDEYLEYSRIVGEDDGGELFTPEQYEEYKKKVLPMLKLQPRENHCQPPLRVGGCTKCAGFKSSFTCGCGAPVKDHTMIVETAEEREARGHPLGESTPYAAMGGITGFSSLADGYQRLDPSGKGLTNPDDEMFDDITERVSQMRRPGEEDMAYYERRYQERRQVVPSGAQGLDNGALRPGSRKAIEQKPGSGRRPASKNKEPQVSRWDEVKIFLNLMVRPEQCSEIQEITKARRQKKTHKKLNSHTRGP
uniref:Protein FAM221A n=1 Tax=Magallana gigas TaxID=29159 RepID=K1QJV8_MAGGI